MKISRVAIKSFGRDEYEGFTKRNVDGDNFLIAGGNRTGKTLTFNALLYTLLGSKNTIDLSPGHSNDVTLTFTDGTVFKRGKPEARWSGSQVLEGEKARQRFSKYLADDLTQEIDASQLIKTHFLHSNSNRLPLSSMSGSDRLALIRAVVNSETQDTLEQNAALIDQLTDEIDRANSDLRRLKDDRQELKNQLSSDQSQLEKYEAIAELQASGDLEEICTLLQRDSELSRRIAELSKERNNLRQTRRSKGKLRGKWKRYLEQERNSVIAEAVNDFVCPACADRVSEDLAEERIGNGRCPFCAVKGRSDELAASVEDKIDRSEEEIEELTSEIEEINQRIGEIDEQIAQLQDEQPSLNKVSTPIERVLRTNDYELDAIIEETESELEKYSQSLKKTRARLEQVERNIAELDNDIDGIEEKITHLEEENERIRTESEREEIQAFTDHWSDEYQSATGEIGLELGLTTEGEVRVPGNETTRRYGSPGELSAAEILLLNITFAVTVNTFARDADLTDWEVIVIDESFATLDEEGIEEFRKYMSSSDLQFICTTSDMSLVPSFNTTFELERNSIQSTIERFV